MERAGLERKCWRAGSTQIRSIETGEFVKVNCAAIPGPLLESELFGYEKGAFTGAVQSKPGRVEMAHRGTLFLDEIAELDLNLQSKLLHFLQDGTYSRIGDHAERKVDARVLCATNKDLEKETAAGRFREDLFYRIHVFRLKLPALRERREDIPTLAEFFRRHYEVQFGMKAQPFSPEMLEYLQNLNWKGNVRELSNGIARYVLIGPEVNLVQEQPQTRAISGRVKSSESEICAFEECGEKCDQGSGAKRNTRNAPRESVESTENGASIEDQLPSVDL